MRGRPRKNAAAGVHTTSVMLGKFFHEAILQLQLRRLQTTDRKPTLRDLVEEGINALLLQEGLQPVHTPVQEPRESSVVPIKKHS